MRVLLVGCIDDRCEHELAAQMLKLSRVRLLYIAGKDEDAREFGFHLYGDYAGSERIADLVRFVCQEHIDLVVIEPENPIANDIRRALERNNVRAFMGLYGALPLFSPPQNYSS